MQKTLRRNDDQMGAGLSTVQVLIGSDFPKHVVPLINQAERTLDVVVFDWRWYPNDIGASVQIFNQAIVRAARRGVKVRALVNYPDIAKTLNEQGCQAKVLTDKQLLHAKLMIVDAAVVVVGSHNYTQRAFNLNHECSVLVEGGSAAAQFSAYFARLWQL
jgi:phosphatidylserine/phosphatidylglycerophosphate/cardiolipin synthase-like enzyme